MSCEGAYFEPSATVVVESATTFDLNLLIVDVHVARHWRVWGDPLLLDELPTGSSVDSPLLLGMFPSSCLGASPVWGATRLEDGTVFVAPMIDAGFALTSEHEAELLAVHGPPVVLDPSITDRVLIATDALALPLVVVLAGAVILSRVRRRRRRRGGSRPVSGGVDA